MKEILEVLGYVGIAAQTAIPTWMILGTFDKTFVRFHRSAFFWSGVILGIVGAVYVPDWVFKTLVIGAAAAITFASIEAKADIMFNGE